MEAIILLLGGLMGGAVVAAGSVMMALAGLITDLVAAVISTH